MAGGFQWAFWGGEGGIIAVGMVEYYLEFEMLNRA